MAIATALTCEIHGEKDGFDLTPGQNLTFNWGISQFLPLEKDMTLLLEVDPAGYDSWQITAIPAARLPTRACRTEFTPWAVSFALVYLPWHAALTSHGFYEFAAKDRFRGASFGISLSKKF